LKLISHPIRWNLPNSIFRKGTHCARHMCENPETLSIAWMHQGPLNPGVPARHLLVDTTWIWALNRRRRRLQAPFSLIPILFQTTVDSTTVARYCCCRPYLCRVCKKVTSSALTTASESATHVCMVSYNADPTLMTAQRECRHMKHVLKQI
jgi:hypothetical protein